MRQLSRHWRAWAGLVAVFLLGAFLLATPARGLSLLQSLKSLVLGDTGDVSMEQQSPLPPAVEVGGPSTAGTVGLTDLTATYAKTDLVIRTSIGPMSFTRTFRTNEGVLAQPSGSYVGRPQWRWQGLTGHAWYDSKNGGWQDISCGLHCTNPVRHADYVIEDPDTGSLLTYYSTAYNSSGAVPQNGYQIAGDPANSAKLYVSVSGSAIIGYALLKPSVHYYFDGGTDGFLARVEDSQYRTLATVAYATGSLISSVTTVDGVQVVFNNTSGVLQSLSIDGGAVAQYILNGSLFTQVTFPETGAGETYSYDGGTLFAVQSLTGQPIVSYVVDPTHFGPNGAVSSQTTEETTLSYSPYDQSPAGVPCPQWAAPCQTRTATDPSATSGDGYLTATTLISGYALDRGTQSGDVTSTGPQTAEISYSYPVDAGQSWQFYLGLAVDTSNEGTPPTDAPFAGARPYALSSTNGNGFYTVYPDAGPTSSSSVPSDAGFLLPIEYPTILSGATNSAGTGALATEARTYAYGGVNHQIRGYEQLVTTSQQPSPLGGNTTVSYNWDTTNNRLKSVVRTGTTVVDYTFGLVQTNIGTLFYYDSLGRVKEMDGPCFIIGLNTAPTGCSTSYPVPKITYQYWGTGSGFNSNHLMTKTVYSGTSALVTNYNSYDARGHVTQSADPNGVITSSVYYGDHLHSQTVGTDVTTYGYDGDQLLWVRHPSKMYDVTCHRIGTSDSSCATGGTPSKFIQWKARCSSTACSSVSAKVVYYYKHGFAYLERYYDNQGQLRRVVQHDRDPRGRPTWDALGDLAYTPNATTALFDNDGNQTAVGFSYNAPPAFCANGNDISSCSELNYNRLDQLLQLAEPSVAPLGQSFLNVQYDSLGHVSSIIYNGQTVTYQYDDFGNLLTVAAPWLTGGPTRYAYDAQGHIVIKNTPAMATGEFLQYDYDGAGRPLDLKHYLGGYTTLWALAYDTSASPGPNCPTNTGASLTNGRVQLRTDSFGETWYTYNFRGQVTAESRVRAGGTACAPLPSSPPCSATTTDTNPNTIYFYDADAGVLNSIQYPHGRIVDFGYGSDSDNERVLSISVGLNTTGPCAQPTTVLTNIAWEPYGGLRGYEIDAPPSVSTAKVAVEYLLGDNSSSSTMTTCPAGSRPSSSGSDHTGRLRALWVSTGAYFPYSPTGTGNIFARQYSWQGDQLTTQATCLLQPSGTPMTESFGYNARLQLQQATRAVGERKAVGGAWGQRSYTYDLRGNRTTEQTDCWGWSESYTNDQLASRTVTSNSCTGTSLPYLTTNYSYDADGRVQHLSSPADSVGPSLDVWFNANIDGQAAIGSVYKAIQVNGSTYEYYYDADGRRRLKTYPVAGEQDEYFYDVNNQLLEDHESRPGSPAIYTLDQYVWLDGRPVILLRGNTTAAGASNLDFTGTCADVGTCGVYFPVTDYLKKPVLLLDSSLLVAGAADYDPFGHVNRVSGAGDTPHPYPASPISVTTHGPAPQVIAGFRQSVPTGASYAVIARARFAMIDTDSSSTAYASLTDLSVNPLLSYPAGTGTVSNVGGPHAQAQASGWAFVPTSPYPGQFQVRFTASAASTRPGIAVAGYEYRKYQTGSTPAWLPLRFPGQYYDAEADLLQNWNRFYDANTGRYLEPEPMWLYPEKLVGLAQAGVSIPVYAYARNNPIVVVDFDGNEGVLVDGLSVTDSGFYFTADNLATVCDGGNSKCTGEKPKFYTKELDAIVAADKALLELFNSGQLSGEALIRILKFLADGGDPRYVLSAIKQATQGDPNHVKLYESEVRQSVAMVHIHVGEDDNKPSDIPDFSLANKYGYDMGVRTFTASRLLVYTTKGIPGLNGGQPGIYQYNSQDGSWGSPSPAVKVPPR